MAKELIHVVAHFSVKSECVDEFIRQASRTLVEPTLGEAGCIKYELCQEISTPSNFALIETWETEEALNTHLAQESLQSAVAALGPMAAGSTTVQRFRPVS